MGAPWARRLVLAEPADHTRSAGTSLGRTHWRSPGRSRRSARWARPGASGCCWPPRPSRASGPPSRSTVTSADIVTGQRGWCQLFSEPGAGSDLAGLTTRALKDGDEWVINGQKVWTSLGQAADLGMLLARTEPEVPKHQGISWMVLDMHQQGVEVRPAARDDRARAVQRGVHHRRPGPGRGRHRRREQRLGGRQHHARLRALRPRRRAAGAPRGSAAMPGTIAGHLSRRAGDFVSGRANRGGAGEEAAILQPMGTQMLLALARENGKDQGPGDPSGTGQALHARRARTLQHGADASGPSRRAGHPGSAQHRQAVDERHDAAVARPGHGDRRARGHAARVHGRGARRRSSRFPRACSSGR